MYTSTFVNYPSVLTRYPLCYTIGTFGWGTPFGGRHLLPEGLYDTPSMGCRSLSTTSLHATTTGQIQRSCSTIRDRAPAAGTCPQRGYPIGTVPPLRALSNENLSPAVPKVPTAGSCPQRGYPIGARSSKH